LRHYIIDGNNLIGKIKSLKRLHTKDKARSAEKLAFILNRYFGKKRVKVSLHFDGFQPESFKSWGLRIIYSGKITADEKIKNEISISKNSKNIILITSDHNLAEFGQVCSCQVVKSEEFSKQLLSSDNIDEEQTKIDEIKNTTEFKKIFGVD
jgi:predicted RNA-binding protein with PIN domain